MSMALDEDSGDPGRDDDRGHQSGDSDSHRPVREGVAFESGDSPGSRIANHQIAKGGRISIDVLLQSAI